MNTDIITDLEKQLALARQAATPVIIEETTDNADEVVYVNHTSGTHRRDLRGGTAPQYHERPVPKVEVPLFDKPVSKDVGRVLRSNDEEREIKLVSGTIRTDLR